MIKMTLYEKMALDYALTTHKNWSEIIAAKDAYLTAIQDVKKIVDSDYDILNEIVEIEFAEGEHQLTDYARELYLGKKNG